MTGVTWAIVAGGAGVALALLGVPPRPRLQAPVSGSGPPRRETGLLRRYRLLVSLLAGSAGVTVLGGGVGLVAGVVAAVLAWVVIGRSEPAHVVRARRLAELELPALVLMLATALRSGAAPDRAVALVASVLPGPAADRLAPVTAQLGVGVDPVRVWAELATDEVLGPLGRVLSRAAESGAPVADVVQRLADDLAAGSRAAVEDRARTVGVRAAVPLGVCLLPAFLLTGVVPVVAGLLSGLLG